MYRQTFWGMGRGPVVYGGMSAYDIAFWDIRSKKFDVPCYQLLGGKTNDSLRSYASQIQFGWGEKIFLCSKPEDYAECALAAVAEGFDAIKVDPLRVDRDGTANFRPERYRQDRHGLMRADDINMGVERIAAIREAAGPDHDIILELHSLLGTHSAIQFIRACEPYGIFYCEEPVNPMNPQAIIKVAADTRTPIATGERRRTLRDRYFAQSARVDPLAQSGNRQRERWFRYADGCKATHEPADFAATPAYILACQAICTPTRPLLCLSPQHSP